MIIGIAMFVTPSIVYAIDETLTATLCIPSLLWYGQFTCKNGQFDGKHQDFHCANQNIFDGGYSNQNDKDEDCGHLIPACVSCQFENDVPLSQGFLCHAAISGCGPILKTIDKKQQLQWKIQIQQNVL